MQDISIFADSVPISDFPRLIADICRFSKKNSHPRVAEKDDGTS